MTNLIKLKRGLALRVGVLVTTGLLLAACGSGAATSSSSGDSSGSAASSEPFVIGATNALSGPYAAAGTNLAAGAQAGVDAVNAAGGINGRQVELLSVDDAGDPAKAQLAVKDLVENKNVDFLIPNAISSVRQVTLPYETANKVFTITGSATGELADPATYPYSFLNGELNERKTGGITQAVQQANLGTKIGLLYTNATAQKAQAATLPSDAEKAGLTLVDSIEIANGATDVTAELAKMQADGVQVVLGGGQYSTFVQTVMSGMETLGWDAPVYFFPEAITGDVHTQIPPSVSSQFHALMEAATIDTGNQSQAMTDFLAATSADGPITYLFAMALSYDAVWLAKWVYETAQEKSGNTSAESLKAAAESIGESDFHDPQLAFVPNPGWNSTTHTTANFDYSTFYGVITDNPIENGRYKGELLSPPSG